MKISHVKNPLTIIAVFACLAEVFGTVVLPFMDPDIQYIFVWFLMFFPIYLVTLFFILLWKKHSNLYAPSDFRNDNSFLLLLLEGTPEDRQRKLEREFREELDQQNDAGHSRLLNSVDSDLSDSPNSIDSPLNASQDNAEGTQDHERTKTQNDSQQDIPSSTIRNAIRAEDLVLKRIPQEMNLKILRNAKFEWAPRVVFDAVGVDTGNIGTIHMVNLIEVKYIRSPSRYPFALIQKLFDRTSAVCDRCPQNPKISFSLILAFVIDSNEKFDRPKFKKRIRDIAERYSFNTLIKFYMMDELENTCECEKNT